ncbi:MAG: hypothetical protein CMJ98_04460 [Planctomycetes bacterium]|jgi:hypothetical protein|nr:hypothetical protein [Planctomycetota bacterium]MBV20883.1 hypothetical protein [Planctomycetaceae bacterium]HJM55801.1 HEAT repeat domain-containing protein [Planctomycetota bacterium]
MSLRPALCLIAALSAFGCTAPSPVRLDRVPLAELPDHYRELWTAWLEEAPDWGERREACRSDPAVCTFLVENLAAVFLGSYSRSELAAHSSGGHGYFERARAELLRLGGDAVPTLMELHLIGDGATAHLTAEVLTAIGVPSIPACLERMERPEAQARRRAIHLLGQLPHGHDLEPRVRTALAERLATDEDWLVRKTAAVAVAHRGGRDTILYPARNALTRALADPDQAVAAAAAMGLASLDDLRAVPDLIGFLRRAEQDSAFALYRVGQEALQTLTGTTGRRSVREWGEWYRTWEATRKKTRDTGN